MKTQTAFIIMIFCGILASQKSRHIKPVPVILTGELWTFSELTQPNNSKVSNKIILGVQMARKSSEKHTKPVFGQSTKTSINLDSLGYLITLFIVGKTISLQEK